MNNVTKTEVRAAVDVVLVVAETIRELKEVPSGVLYANLMGHLSLADYTKIVGILKRSNLVEEKSHVLRWVGPALSS